ncbi:MAG: TIGR01777 family oxidoreductase [Gemmatimonadales bacterium]|nr:TIGR01777 family oxidoreductase [Gemmatimonadota bacterium]MCL4213968.1 TIGR01777 family oxidoreductase [Gemmatimonadales bacterium]
MKRVAITGASGFIGRALAANLIADGVKVVSIGRGAGSDVQWDPAAGRLDASALEGVEAVVHLAGASVAERWTAERKRVIRESRVQGTRLIAERCAGLATKPAVLVCASGIGYHGSRGDEWLDETSSPGDDFLAGVVRDWEAAADPARAAGIRVVHLRTGIALNPRGGALGKMLLPFQLGVGGRLGSGHQWMSWISLHDLVRAFRFVMETPSISGPVNATAPEPVTNRTFTATLARVLKRPALVPVPAFALRALLGEMADGTVLASQRVRATVLAGAGFRFEHPTLSTALRSELDLR